MSFNRKIATTIVIQAVGPLSFFVAVWFLSKTMGAEAQGKFSTVKSFVDLSLTLLVFGFPQSFIYGINRLNINRGLLVRWTIKYGTVCFFISSVIMMMFKYFTFGPQELIGSNLFSIFILAMSISGLVVTSLLRGVLLTITDGGSFSLISILPTVFLSTFIVLMSCANYFDPLMMFLGSGVLSAITGMWFVRGCCAEIGNNKQLPWTNLITNGGAEFIRALLVVSQPFVTLTLIKKYGGDYSEIAFFSLSMYVYQAGVVPLTMVSPILYNRWTKSSDGSDIVSDVKKLILPVMPLALLMIIVAQMVGFVVPIVFSSDYNAAVRAIQIMLLTVPLLYIVQVGTPIIMSQGLFKTNTFIVFIKLVVCVFCLMVLLPVGSNYSKYAAISWALSEFIASMLILFITIRIIKSVRMAQVVSPTNIL